MDVRLPDGTIIRNVPEGTTRAELVDKLRRNGMPVPAEWLTEQKQEQQAAPTPRPTLATALGRTARSAMVGPSAALSLFTEPIRYLTDKGYEFAVGKPSGSVPLGQLASEGADALGLPVGQTPMERIVDKGTELGFGTMFGAGLLGRFGNLLSKSPDVRGIPTTAQETFRRLATDPLGQTVAATGGGMAGQQAKEVGAGPIEQGIAAAGGAVLSAGG